MTTELLIGGLIILSLVAAIIVVMTTQKRVEYSGSNREQRERTARKRSNSDR